MRRARIHEQSRHGAAGRISGRWKCACGLLASAAVCVLAPLAWASPPDPLWIAGIYDGADHDEEIDLATSAAAVGEELTCRELRLPVVAASPPRGPHSVTRTSGSSLDSVRAPPTV